MNPRSSLLILDTKTLLVHRMSARKTTRVSPILVGTCPLSSSGAGVSISSSAVWADLVSCFDQQRGTSVRLCDPGPQPWGLLQLPSWKPAAMWKVPALPLVREALWRVRLPRVRDHVGRAEGPAAPLTPPPPPPVVFPAASAHMLYICVRLSWRLQPPPSSQLGAHVTSADASRNRRTGRLSSAWIPDPQNHGL